MKVCIVSDSHDRGEPLAQAVREAKAQGAEVVLHCGDLIGTQTLRPTLALGLPVHIIHGNNIGDPQSLHRWAAESHGQLRYHGVDGRLELAGKRIIMLHYDDYGYAMACTGHWDLVCCGHSHRAEARQVPSVDGKSTWLVNPGTVAGLSATATWMMGDLTAMRFEVHELGPTPHPQGPNTHDRPTPILAKRT